MSYIKYIAAVLLVANSALADGKDKNSATCQELLKSKPVHSLVAAYLKNVEANPLSAKQKKQAHPLIDQEPASARKVNFIKKRADLLEKMIKRRELTLDELRVAPIYKGEVYKNGKYVPYGDVLIAGGKVFVFGDDAHTVTELKKAPLGFLSEYVNSIRLDKKFVLNFADGQVAIQPVEFKDPTTLPEFEKRLPADSAHAALFREKRDVIAEMLVNTHFDLYTFIQSIVSEGIIRENGAKIYVIVNQSTGQLFYITDKPGVLEADNQKIYGWLSSDTRIGFQQDYERTLELATGETLTIKNGAIVSDLSHNLEAAATVLDYLIKASPKDAQEALTQNREALLNLVQKKIVSANFVEFQQLIQVLHPITGAKYYVIETKQGFVALDPSLPNKWAFLRDLDTSLPAVWIGPNGIQIVIRESVGFVKEIVEEVRKSTSPDLVASGRFFSSDDFEDDEFYE